MSNNVKPSLGQYITPTFDYRKMYPKQGKTEDTYRREVMNFAKRESLSAIKMITTFMNDPDAPLGIRMQCCQILLDRAWGKPTQSVAITEVKEESHYDFDNLSVEELQNLETLMKKAQPKIIDVEVQEVEAQEDEVQH